MRNFFRKLILAMEESARYRANAELKRMGYKPSEIRKLYE